MQSFDLSVSISAPVIVEPLSDRDQETLFNHPSNTYPKLPVQDDQIYPAMEGLYAREEEPLLFSTTEEIIEGYENVSKKAKELLDTSRTRFSSLVLIIDQTRNPELYEAANSLFDSSEPVTRITYDMYLTLLEYIEDLGAEIGRAL